MTDAEIDALVPLPQPGINTASHSHLRVIGYPAEQVLAHTRAAVRAALAAQAQTATVADLELMRQARDAIVASGLSGTKTKQARVAAAAALTARLAEPVQASSDVPEANCGKINAMQEGRDRYTNKASIMAFVEGAWWAAQQLAAPGAAPTVQPVAVPDGLSRSDAQFWLDRRGQIIEACQREGYSIVTTAHGTHLMKLGEVRAHETSAPKGGA